MKTIVIIAVATGLASYILTCWAIIDVVLKQFDSIEKKAVWGIIAFIPFIGWPIYFLFGRKQGTRAGRSVPAE